MGLFGLGIPEEYGGLGLSLLERCLLLEELGRGPAGFVSVIGAHTGIGSTGIVELGTARQKERYLPAMARGEKLGAFALTEQRVEEAAIAGAGQTAGGSMKKKA